MKDDLNKQKLPENIKKILVRSTNWVGDSVISTPVFRYLKNVYPHAAIDVLARPWNAPVFENNPFINQVAVFNEKAGIREYLKSIRFIRKNAYDLAVLLPNSFSSALQSRLGKARYRLGFDTDKRKLLLTHPVEVYPDPFPYHQVFYYLSLLEQVTGQKAEEPRLELFVSPEEDRRAREFLSNAGIRENSFFLGLNPGAEYGPAKRYPAERFANVADLLVAEYNAMAIIFGSGKEAEIAAQVEKQMHFKALNLAGKTDLRLLIALIRRMKLFITNDTGSMHIAAALNVPVVAIFGSTNFHATGPFSKNSTIVRTKTMPECSPCLQRTCSRNFSCMLTLPPQAVYARTVRFMQSRLANS